MKIIKMIDDRILVCPIQNDSVTKGGLIIPDTAKAKPIFGVVRATNNSTILKVGDKVLYEVGRYTHVEINGEDMVIMNDTDPLAVIE